MSDELPSVKNKPNKPVVVEDPKPSIAKTVVNLKIDTVVVEFPYVTVEGEGYQDNTFRVDLGSITRDQLRKVKALRRGLDAQGATLNNGSPIKSNIDAVRYLIDSLDI